MTRYLVPKIFMLPNPELKIVVIHGCNMTLSIWPVGILDVVIMELFGNLNYSKLFQKINT